MTPDQLEPGRRQIEHASIPDGGSINKLHNRGSKLRRIGHAIESFSTDSRIELAHAAMGTLLGSEAADTYIRKCLKLEETSPLLIRDMDLSDIPQFRRDKVLEMYNNKTAQMWPLLAFVGAPEVCEEFSEEYDKVAKRLGLFPYAPTLEAVPAQRSVAFQDRVLAAQLTFLQRATEGGSLNAGIDTLISMIGNAKRVYAQYGVPELQQAVQAKVLPNVAKLEALQQDEIWQEHDALVNICLDRGLRDSAIFYYGLGRDREVEGVSGYGSTQDLLSYGSTIRGILRVH